MSFEEVGSAGLFPLLVGRRETAHALRSSAGLAAVFTRFQLVADGPLLATLLQRTIEPADVCFLPPPPLPAHRTRSRASGSDRAHSRVGAHARRGGRHGTTPISRAVSGCPCPRALLAPATRCSVGGWPTPSRGVCERRLVVVASREREPTHGARGVGRHLPQPQLAPHSAAAPSCVSRVGRDARASRHRDAIAQPRRIQPRRIVWRSSLHGRCGLPQSSRNNRTTCPTSR